MPARKLLQYHFWWVLSCQSQQRGWIKPACSLYNRGLEGRYSVSLIVYYSLDHSNKTEGLWRESRKEVIGHGCLGVFRDPITRNKKMVGRLRKWWPNLLELGPAGEMYAP